MIHTFGADMKWHPHIHLIVTGGGLSLDGKRWIETDPKFLMYHGGLKKRWKLIPKPLIKIQKFSVFDHYSPALAGFQHSIIPCGWHKKRCH